MNRSRVVFTIACIVLSQLLDSCHSSRKAAASKSQPKFINDVSISPHNKSNVTHNAIDAKKYPKASYSSTKPVAVAPTHTNKVDKEEPASVVRRKYAGIIGVKPNEITNYPLYRFIDKWYGTNYRLGGQDDKGIDCSGFAQKLYGEVYGIDLLRTAMEQFTNCKRIRRSTDAREGDLVFFHIRSKRITHVGVYLANNFFVHSSTSGGVMISNLNEDYWHKYYAGCGRLPRG